MSKIPDEKTPLQAGAEAQLARAPLTATPGRSDKELLHELQVYQIKLEMQNEELRRMHAALEESRDRYVDLYELAPVGYLTLTDTGTITEINLTGAALLGEERQGLVRRRFTRFIAAGDSDRWQRLFLNILRHGDRQSCELTIDRGDGSSFNALLDCIRTGRTGEAHSVRIILTDITGRKRAEELLRKSSEEIADLYNHAPCGYHSLDKDGIIRRINDTELAWLGYTRDEVVGKIKATDLITPASRQIFRENYPRFMKQGIVHDLEFEMIRKDGTVFTALVNATALYDPSGAYVMSRSTVTDISRRKRGMEELRANEEKYRVLYESSRDALMTLAPPSWKFTSANRSTLLMSQ